MTRPSTPNITACTYSCGLAGCPGGPVAHMRYACPAYRPFPWYVINPQTGRVISMHTTEAHADRKAARVRAAKPGAAFVADVLDANDFRALRAVSK